MVRQLCVPVGFGARLHFGPVASRPRCPRALVTDSAEEVEVIGGDLRTLAELGKDHAGMIEMMEDELIEIEGLTGKDAEKRKGRSKGPRYA